MDAPLREDAVLARELALDLGTSSTRLYVRGSGIVFDEPTVAALDRRGHVTSIGKAALTEAADGSHELVRPVQHGTAADQRLVEEFVTRLISGHRGGLFDRSVMVVSVPSASSPIERRIVREALQSAGADRVYVMEHVLAAAIGNDLKMHEPVGTMIVDVGAGITEVALLSLGAVVAASSIRTGSLDVDRAIQAALRREYAMAVTDKVAEEIKIAASSFVTHETLAGESVDDEDQPLIEARGYSIVDDSEMTAILEGGDVAGLLQDHWNSVVEAVRATLVQAPPELGQDLFTRGIRMVGAGARVPALATQLHSAFGLPVHVGNEAHLAVINGAAKCLEAPEVFSDIFLGEQRLA